MIAFTPPNPYFGTGQPPRNWNCRCTLYQDTTSATGSNTVLIFGGCDEGIIYYGESLHPGIKTEDIAKLYGVFQTCLIEDRKVQRFVRKTIRKEGREDSKRGWHKKLSSLRCQVVLRNPQHPYRLMLGGANRC